MKKRTFDLIVIALISIILLILNKFELLEKYSKFALLPILVFYYLGQYAEKNLKS